MRAAPVILALVLFAGCLEPEGTSGTKLSASDGPAASTTPTAAPVVPGVDPTLPLGSIKGRVLSDEQLPVANISVILVGFNVSATTNADGEFFFNDVNTGDYFLVARGDGYREKQMGVQVREAELSEVSFILESIPKPVPRIEGPFIYRKSINCARSHKAPVGEEEFAAQPQLGLQSHGIGTSNARFASDPCPFNVVLGPEWVKNSTGDVQTQPGLVGVIFEASWNPSTTASKALELNVSLQPLGAKSGFDVRGLSPLNTVKSLSGLQEYRAASAKHRDYGSAAGVIKYSLDVEPSVTGQAVDVGLALDQNVEVAVTLFYVVEPADYKKHFQYK